MYISREQLEEVLEHAIAESPNEACGILAGQNGRVTRVYRGTNVEAEARLRFQLDPQQQLEAMQDLQNNGWEMLGIYHSHPHSPAYPSETDVQMAFYPDSAYVIVSLAVSPPEVKAFRIVDGMITIEQLIIT